ncbi:hypothetical protein ABZT27_34245 [Streptomyces sp. NPDC005389]|uniref:hypothetical protein n=1 Tax=Streptomyces sp. NPDC005389 TaxID=3157040 RepID=UPI0033B78E06
MTMPTTAPPTRTPTEAEAGEAFRKLQAAMEGAGLPANGLYRDVRRGQGGDLHLFGLGHLTMAGAERLTAILRAARRQP